jgi:hypothetical protein
LLELETGESFHGIGAHAQDHAVHFFKLLGGVTKLGRFGRSTGSTRFWKEKKDNVLALKVLQRDVVALIGRDRKRGGVVADSEHRSILSAILSQLITKAACERYRSRLADSPGREWPS